MTMRVAIVTDALAMWGAETSLKILVDELQVRGRRVTVLAHPKSPLRKAGLRTEVVPAPMARRRMRDSGGMKILSMMFGLDVLDTAASAVRLAKMLRGYDVVVCFGTWELGQVALAAKLARRPCVLDLHETFRVGKGTRLLDIMSKGIAGIITTSASIAPSGLPQSHIAVVGRPVLPAGERVESPRRAGAPLEVLMPGQVIPHKQVLEAVELVPRARANLTVVGASAPDRQSTYERLVRLAAARAPRRVDVLERTPRITDYYDASDVVVNLSIHEAWGRTIVEGMAHGCWPIALKGGAPGELVRDLGVGTLISNLDELPGALNDLAECSGDRWDSMRNAARLAAKAFEPLAIAESYWQALTALAYPSETTRPC